MRPEGLGTLIKLNYFIVFRTRDLPACSVVRTIVVETIKHQLLTGNLPGNCSFSSCTKLAGCDITWSDRYRKYVFLASSRNPKNEEGWFDCKFI
jgi:hypothetical protein